MSKTHHPQHGSAVVDTVQSLIVAFVLAMTFRSFVTEGFVIPTGSMAPTLMGEHLLIASEETGAEYPISALIRSESWALKDPMLGPSQRIEQLKQTRLKRRMGDRVLVLKSLYPFSQPDRFDVVVFKNPTDPKGSTQNYIKRLVGLPNEKIWLADGDVFAGDVNQPGLEGYQVQRKPEHIQRTVWQPIYHSDYYPTDPGRLPQAFRGPYWQGEHWETQQQSTYTCDTTDTTQLKWNVDARPINDWNIYNITMQSVINAMLFHVNDVRASAGVVAENTADLNMTFRIEAREHLFEYVIADGQAHVRMKPMNNANAPWTQSALQAIDLPDNHQPWNVECWHVDQSLSLFINQEKVAYLEYDWSPADRVQYTTGHMLANPTPDELSQLCADTATPAQLTWECSGSPLQLHRVRLDRDLHYRYTTITRSSKIMQPTPDGYEEEFFDLIKLQSPGYATTPNKPAMLQEDHFLMLGDNSSASSDSRLWGNVHPYVAAQIDVYPFVVHRKLLLGKAWMVYFPAPYSMSEDGRAFIPDFGRLRFIR